MDAAVLAIYVKSTGTKYEIRKNGIEVARVTIATLQKMIGDGTAQTEYGIGAQLILSYTDPFNHIEYECPMNFATFREFELEDGTKFNGLGLQSLYAVLTQSVQFDGGKKARWSVSSLRQFMNSGGFNWYSAQYEGSTTPSSPDPTIVKGLLDSFPAEFISKLAPVQRITKYSSDIDTTYDTLFPLSGSETAYADISDTTEGSGWEYWRQQGSRVVYFITDHSNVAYAWLRSSRDNIHEEYMHDSGSLGNTTASQAWCSVVPACVLPPA